MVFEMVGGEEGESSADRRSGGNTQKRAILESLKAEKGPFDDPRRGLQAEAMHRWI